MCQSLSIGLTPNEWFTDNTNKKKNRQLERKSRRIEKRKEAYRQQQQEKLKKERKPLRRQRQPSKDAVQKEPEPEPDFEDEPLTSSDEETPLYYEGAEELLAALAKLERDNSTIEKKIQERKTTLLDFQQNVA